MAPEFGMVIGPGARLDAYEIIAPVGSGGMGEVWLARDLRLDRKVALKVLPLHLSEDPDRIARLRQEARAASGLNHPNVCTIYALGSADDGRVFIAMEYIEGRTLRQRLAGVPIAMRQALDIAIQIASALGAAHDAGVIHRDVKPENLMVRTDGLLKVLDFGLAKVDAAASVSETTRTALRTQAVAGTVAYMSPEQARGEPLDRRSDIFSLGAVLYEMITGRQAFTGTSEAVVHDAILNRMPTPPLRVNPDLPARLNDIVNKALEKDRDLRYQTAAELRTDLIRLKRDSDPLGTVGHPVEKVTVASDSYRRNRGAAVAVVLLLAALGLIATRWRTLTSLFRRSDLQEIQLTTNSSEAPVSAGAISPDGKYLAYADEGGVHIRSIDSRETETIAFPENGGINRLSWFPDGSKLLVSADRTTADRAPAIWFVSLIGGTPRRLRDDGIEGAVSPDGAHITFVDASRSSVWIMSAVGEEPHQVVTSNTADEFHMPGFWWNGTHVYARVRLVEDRARNLNRTVTMEMRDPDGHTDVLLSDAGLRGAVRLPDGRLIYSLVSQPVLNLGGSLWEVDTDSKTGAPKGQPRRMGISPGSAGLWQFSSTADGTRVVFLKRSPQRDVYTADLPAGPLMTPRRLTLDDSDDWATNWTPDSKAILFTSDRNGTRDIFKQGLDQRSAEAIVTGPDDESGPAAITPDGAWFYYIVSPKGWLSLVQKRMTIMRIPASGGPPQRVTEQPEFQFPLCARSPSNTCVLVEQDGRRDVIYALDSVHGKGRRIASTELESDRYCPVDISPDGSRVAVEMAAEGRIRIVSLQGDPDRDVTIHDRPITTDSFYWSSDGGGWYVPSVAAPGTDLLHVDLDGHIRVVWHEAFPTFMSAIPSPDGRRLALTQTSMISNVWMIKQF
jgi:eukaryotic-like serine/threonine-protein kinase